MPMDVSIQNLSNYLTNFKVSAKPIRIHKSLGETDFLYLFPSVNEVNAQQHYVT